jgi:hypothetical protein
LQVNSETCVGNIYMKHSSVTGNCISPLGFQ